MPSLTPQEVENLNKEQDICAECLDFFDPDELHEHPSYPNEVVCKGCIEDGIEEPSLDWMIDEDEDEYWDHEE